MNEIRKLNASEIEVRVGQVYDTGLTLLLYKDARVDMNLLDESFGPLGWQKHYELIGDRLYCTIELWDKDKGQWVKKQDVGVESNAEAEKGQASDAFKRAGFNVGIGRELYSAPFIWIPKDKVELVKNPKTGKMTTREKFCVNIINYNGQKISALQIKNRKGEVVFNWQEKK